MNFMNNPNIPPIINNPNIINDILYKLNEYDNRIKKLEQKVSRLESNNTNYNNYNNEPDNNMYMI